MILNAVLVVVSALTPVRSSSSESDPEKTPAQLSGTASDRGVSNKLKLLEKLTSSSTTRERVVNSGNADAMRSLAAATHAQQLAADALDAGDLEEASEAIRVGYAQMTLALRSAKDVGQQAERDAVRYEKLRKRVFSFSEALQRIAREKKDPAIYDLQSQQDFNQLLQDAELLSGEGDYQTAIVRMSEASTIIERALSVARHRETLMHELTFQTPQEEYAYELRRNESYAMLVRLLDGQSDIPSGALDALKAAQRRNESVREQAQKSFNRGEVEQAIVTLEKSSEEVARVLRMSGLAF